MARTGVCVPLEALDGIEPPTGGRLHRCDPVAPYCRRESARRAVCPSCHALLTSALPTFSPDAGAGLCRLSETKKKEGKSLPAPVKPGGGQGRIRTGCLPLCCGCASVSTSRPYSPPQRGDNPKCLGISSCRLLLVFGNRRQRDLAIVLVRKDLGHDLHQSIHIKHVRSSFAVPVQPGSPYPGATVLALPGYTSGCTLLCRTFRFYALLPEPVQTGSCSLPPYGPARHGRRRLLVCVF